MADEQNGSAAWPVADAALTQEILDLVQQASHYRQYVYCSDSGSSPLNKAI